MDQQRPKLAQMMKPILLSSLAALWMSIGAVAWAQTNVPEAGLAADRMADGTMRFASTAGVLNAAAEPTCGCGWRTSTRDSSASLTLPRRCRVPWKRRPMIALHFRLSQAHAAANDAVAAQRAIERALTLRPTAPGMSVREPCWQHGMATIPLQPVDIVNSRHCSRQIRRLPWTWPRQCVVRRNLRRC